MFVNVDLSNLIMRSQVRRVLHPFSLRTVTYTQEMLESAYFLGLNLTVKIGQEELHEALYLQKPSASEQCLHMGGGQ